MVIRTLFGQQRVIMSRFNTDACFDVRTGDESLDFEDVVVLGDWVDDDGSTGGERKASVMIQGVDNDLMGTDAGLMGFREHKLTSRGNVVTVHRQRRRDVFLENKK